MARGAQRSAPSPIPGATGALPPKRKPTLRRSQLESRLLAGSRGDVEMLLNPPPRVVAQGTCEGAHQDNPFLPGDTVLTLGAAASSSSPPVGTAGPSERVQRILAYLSDPEKARACATMEQVETPDFCAADAPMSLGKTRGASVSAVGCHLLTQCDTSDEAYLARHLRHERAEKKLRKQEKEALVQDRRRILARIASLEQADVTLLVPAFAAREAERGAAPQSDEAMIAHLSLLHGELLSDARATLARYDKLLPDEAKHDRHVPVVGRRVRASASPASPVHESPEPHIVKEPKAMRGVWFSPPYHAPAPRVGPSLAELATMDRLEQDASVYPSPPPQRRNSSRRKKVSAFGERVPDIAAHRAPFESAMAHFLGSPP